MTNSRDLASYDDFLAMQALNQRVWRQNPRWHVGELAWSRFSPASADAALWRTRLWFDGSACVAWGWLEPPGELSLAVDPDVPGLSDEVLGWLGETAAPGDPAGWPELSCLALETEEALVERLEAFGFEARPDAPYFRYHAQPLDDLPAPELPAGFSLRHVEPGEAAPRAAVHRAGWSDFGSTLSTERYTAVMAAWPYRPELDWVVVAPDGSWVASALGWLDEVNRAGLLEPVGCAPAYRRMGLARAVDLACLHALRDAGAETAHVNPRGDDAYPVPGLLYRSLGFRPGPRTITYERPSGPAEGDAR